MNWKKVFKITKVKSLSLLIPFVLGQVYIIRKVNNPMCIGSCSEQVYSLAFKAQTWLILSFEWILLLVALIVLASMISQLVKKK